MLIIFTVHSYCSNVAEPVSKQGTEHSHRAQETVQGTHNDTCILELASFPVSTPQLFSHILLCAKKSWGVETGNEARLEHGQSMSSG